MNIAYTDSKITLYESMAKNESSQMMLESFSDYYVQVEAVISKFLKFLREKLDTFYNNIEGVIAANSELSSNKKSLIEDIKDYECESCEGFNYTINENIPDTGAIDKFNASLFDELFKSSVNDLNAEAVKSTVTSIELEQDYRKFRARILGKNDELSESEFVKYLYMAFRDNNAYEIELGIDAAEIKKIAEAYFKFSDIKSEMDKQYTEISKAYEGILKKISIVSSNNNNLTVQAFTNLLPNDIGVEKIDGKDTDNNGMMMSADMMLQLDIYCKAKTDQVIKYTDITMMCMAAKMDAIADMYNQNTNILRTALDVIKYKEEKEEDSK